MNGEPIEVSANHQLQHFIETKGVKPNERLKQMVLDYRLFSFGMNPNIDYYSNPQAASLDILFYEFFRLFLSEHLANLGDHTIYNLAIADIMPKEVPLKIIIDSLPEEIAANILDSVEKSFEHYTQSLKTVQQKSESMERLKNRLSTQIQNLETKLKVNVHNFKISLEHAEKIILELRNGQGKGGPVEGGDREIPKEFQSDEGAVMYNVDIALWEKRIIDAYKNLLDSENKIIISVEELEEIKKAAESRYANELENLKRSGNTNMAKRKLSRLNKNIEDLKYLEVENKRLRKELESKTDRVNRENSLCKDLSNLIDIQNTVLSSIAAELQMNIKFTASKSDALNEMEKIAAQIRKLNQQNVNLNQKLVEYKRELSQSKELISILEKQEAILIQFAQTFTGNPDITRENIFTELEKMARQYNNLANLYREKETQMIRNIQEFREQSKLTGNELSESVLGLLENLNDDNTFKALMTKYIEDTNVIKKRLESFDEMEKTYNDYMSFITYQWPEIESKISVYDSFRDVLGTIFRTTNPPPELVAQEMKKILAKINYDDL